MYDHYRSVGEPATKVGFKKKRPKSVAVVDEDNCTGCQVCIPFCPVDCIEPVPKEKYDIPYIVTQDIVNYILKDGEVKDRFVGVQPKEVIKEKITSLG